MQKWLVFCLGGLLMIGCSNLKQKKEEQKIARVGNHYLYIDEIQELGLSAEDPTDSIKIVEAYINNWIRKEAYLQHAKEQLSTEQQRNITDKLDDYQTSLYISEYEKRMLQSKLDTSFTEDEIKLYYDNHKEDYNLQEPIYRVLILKKDQPFSEVNQISSWIHDYLEQGNDAQLSEYCLYNTISCYLDSQNWLTDKELVETFQMKSEYVSRRVNEYIQLNSDDGYYYLYKIIEKQTNGIYPLSMVEPEIKNILLKIREREFVEALRNEIFNQKKSENQIETYN